MFKRLAPADKRMRLVEQFDQFGALPLHRRDVERLAFGKPFPDPFKNAVKRSLIE